MSGFLARYRHARAIRSCPACWGSGIEIDWRAVRMRDCYLCGGDGEVRFTAWTAFRVAIGWTNEEIRYSLEHEPHFG